MPLPASLVKAGYLTPAQIAKTRRLMISLEGETNTGKTEFMMSAPPPIGILGLDRNIDGVFMNPIPPSSRLRDGVGFKLMCTLGPGQATKDDFIKQWNDYYTEYRALLSNPDVMTVGLDGDSDSWELQRLAEFGTLSQIPSILYDKANAARRAMIRRAWDSGKIIISTSKVTDIYVDKVNADGSPVLGNNGKPTQVKSGQQRRQGFGDHSYLWQIQLRTLYRAPHKNEQGKHVQGKWGAKILACKSSMDLIGTELWGEECCFEGLVGLVFPNISREEWGFE